MLPALSRQLDSVGAEVPEGHLASSLVALFAGSDGNELLGPPVRARAGGARVAVQLAWAVQCSPSGPAPKTSLPGPPAAPQFDGLTGPITGDSSPTQVLPAAAEGASGPTAAASGQPAGSVGSVHHAPAVSSSAAAAAAAAQHAAHSAPTHGACAAQGPAAPAGYPPWLAAQWQLQAAHAHAQAQAAARAAGVAGAAPLVQLVYVDPRTGRVLQPAGQPALMVGMQVCTGKDRRGYFLVDPLSPTSTRLTDLHRCMHPIHRARRPSHCSCCRASRCRRCTPGRCRLLPAPLAGLSPRHPLRASAGPEVRPAWGWGPASNATSDQATGMRHSQRPPLLQQPAPRSGLPRWRPQRACLRSARRCPSAPQRRSCRRWRRPGC